MPDPDQAIKIAEKDRSGKCREDVERLEGEVAALQRHIATLEAENGHMEGLVDYRAALFAFAEAVENAIGEPAHDPPPAGDHPTHHKTGGRGQL